VKLETQRLVLRRPEDDDLDAVLGIHGDPEVMRYIGAGEPWSPQRAELGLSRWKAYWHADEFGMFVVTRRGDDQVLGDVGLLAWNPQTWTPGMLAAIGSAAEIEIGWTLARDAWGHGYATEAALAVRDWARAEHGFDRLISLIHPENAASMRVAEKLGAKHERDVEIGGRTARIYASYGGQGPAR
jgi:RimJ/RimL family protein N-acetyltransferase